MRWAHYANECASNSAHKRSARAGRAFCAPCAYLYATIDRAHSYVVLNSHSTDLSYHDVYRSVPCGHHRCLSPTSLCRFRRCRWKNLSIARAHVWHLSSLLSQSVFLVAPLFRPVSPFRETQTEKRRGEADQEEVTCQYIWRAIRNFYQRKFHPRLSAFPRGHSRPLSFSFACTFKSYFSLLSRQLK